MTRIYYMNFFQLKKNKNTVSHSWQTTGSNAASVSGKKKKKGVSRTMVFLEALEKNLFLDSFKSIAVKGASLLPRSLSIPVPVSHILSPSLPTCFP